MDEQKAIKEAKQAVFNKVLSQIADKYGPETLVDPRELIRPEETEQYREQIDEKLRKLYVSSESEKVDAGGFLLSEDLVNIDNNRTCPVCDTYSFESRDDLYMTKFDCCFQCYIDYVEGREARWKTGWRPTKHEN
jgi:hypothetical protein